MRVLHLLKSSAFSGAENVVCQIISLNKNNNDIDMVYCSVDGEIRQALQERNIEFYPLDRFSLSEIKKIISKYKPDIIHAHDMHASLMASILKGNAKIISHIHNNAYASRKVSVKSVLFLLASIRCSHIFWVSDSALEDFRFKKYVNKKSTVLYNIIDSDKLLEKLNFDNEIYNYDMVFLGRLSYEKNPQRMLEIFEKVVKKMPNIKLGIVGAGELEEELKDISVKKKLTNNITFLGYQRNPLKMLHDSKIMIMTSRWEGLPMCALEAMALGVPIVSTPTDGLKILIKNGENGFLSDDNNVLANHIISILTKHELYEKLKSNQQKIFKEYNDANKYLEELITEYNR